MMPILVTMAVFLLVCAWFHEKKWELFYVSIRNGRALVVRGRVPAGLFHDLSVIIREPVVGSGWIRVFRGEHGAELFCGGDIEDGPEQRIRNAMMLYSLSNLRHALPVPRPTLGQVLGIAWLAWMFDRRDV
jgi:hypothetical protein